MRKILIFYIVLFLLIQPVYAVIADDSVDASIRKTYNTDIVEKNLLPNLPQVEPTVQYDSQSTIFEQEDQPINNIIKTQSLQITQNYDRQYKEIKVRKGTRFKLKLQNSIGDTTPRGTRITMVSVYPEASRYVTIPAGTVFRGQVINSHPPQLLGNGGLVEIKMDELIYKGSAYHIDSKVSIANYKRIYLDNIKGRQKYLKSMGNFTRPGNRFMNKMWRVSERLSDGGAEVILVPVALFCGVAVYGFNMALSPVLSLFSMGESMRIPRGTYFEIKLTENALIREY